MILFPRFFTKDLPDLQVPTRKTDATIKNDRGEVVFHLADVEVPEEWSDLAARITAQKYFVRTGVESNPRGRETSAVTMCLEVATTIADAGLAQGYFDAAAAGNFRDELYFLLVNQYGAFNSPVWFNVRLWHSYGIRGNGVNWWYNPETKQAERVQNAYEHPGPSACFIQSLEDNLCDEGGIADFWSREARVFKQGSGSGTNASKVREQGAPTATDGEASGVISFLKVADYAAGAIKSGGGPRRAAKMVCLDVDHPDISAFIQWKVDEERKAQALMAAGFSKGMEGEAYTTVSGQNANHSIRLPDAFMRAVEQNGPWELKSRVGGKTVKTVSARGIWNHLCLAAWEVADPGVQFDDTINRWHTTPSAGRIRGSNPCVTGDTLISTALGWKRIDQMLDQEQLIRGSDGQFHACPPAFKTGTKAVYKLRTKAGYTLKLTGDHKVRTVSRGDVPASELTRDDHIYLQGAGFGELECDTHLSEVIGLLLGDGCVCDSIATLTMGHNEHEVVAYATKRINQAKDYDRACSPRHTPTGWRVSTSYAALISDVQRYAVLDQGSSRKALTPVAFLLERPAIAGILRGLFTADGTVADYGDRSQYVSLDSTSELLLEQVQLLLLNFGIKSKIYRNRRGGKTFSSLPDGKGGMREYPVVESHSLRISRSSRLLFERKIGFLPMSAKADTLVCLNDRVKAYQDQLMDKVAAVEFLGVDDVYDITEGNTHHFVANGLVVHNCSEYMSLDDSACNLASLRLTKFFVGDVFNAKAFRHAVRTFIIAQDILVDFGSYPTKKIAENTHRYRQLGLGYCDLGALLMLRGLSYASEEGRQFASAITALLNAHAWATSAELAKELGPFEGFAADREYVLSVLAEHQRHVGRTEQQLNVLATDAYREAYMEAYKYGVRNSQLTLLAPTGTIGFLMDATTTGVEPLLSHVQYKTLAGGGNEVLENKEVAPTLKRLGYRDNEISRIIEGLRTGGALTALVRPEHKAIFLTALGPGETLPPEAHVDMIAAVQPHLSGAVSKTCNLPATATVEDISNLYFRAWRAGVKALAVYRAGSKGAEPVKTSKTSKTSEEEPKAPVQPYQRKLPPECQGTGWRAVLDRVWKLYIHSGEYPDGTLGEVFVTVGKDGSTVAGLISAWAQAVSIGLQYGVPLAKFVDVFTHGRFEPAGNVSGHASIKRATSLVDLVMRILAVKYLQRTDLAHVHAEEEKPAEDVHGDGPLCHICHSVTVRNGSCHRCPNCGESLGCS